eukprot:g723.t1
MRTLLGLCVASLCCSAETRARYPSQDVVHLSAEVVPKLFLDTSAWLVRFHTGGPNTEDDDTFAALGERLRELESIHVLRCGSVECSVGDQVCSRFGVGKQPVFKAWHLPGSAAAREEQGLAVRDLAADRNGTVHLRTDQSVYQVLGIKADDGEKRVLLQRLPAEAQVLGVFGASRRGPRAGVLDEAKFIGELELEKRSAWLRWNEQGKAQPRGFPWAHAPEIEPGFADVEAYVEREEFQPQQRAWRANEQQHAD